jgi:nucleotide-binding universal stress UspA family protein
MRVLIAVDGSEASEAAVRSVQSRTWPSATVLRVLSVAQHVYPPPPQPATMAFGMSPYQDASMLSVQQQLRDHASEIAQRAARMLEESGLQVEAVSDFGDPRDVILDQATTWRADLIVVGSHGRTGLRRWMLGSVAESVVRHAPCSVEVARVRSD